MCYSIAMKAKSFEEIPADLSAVESEPKKTEASEMPVKQSVEQSEKVDRRPEAIAAREAAHMEALEKKFGGLPLEDLIQQPFTQPQRTRKWPRRSSKGSSVVS